MRALETFNSHIVSHAGPVVLDAAHAGRLRSLASARLHGSSRLARVLRQAAAVLTVVPSDEMPEDAVNIGSEVTYRDETTGRSCTIRLALPHEADVPAGRISLLTPVGTALIGRTQGATVDCEFPAGTMRQLTVLRVDQPTALPGGRSPDATLAAGAAMA